jgi:hypothetical protein
MKDSGIEDGLREEENEREEREKILTKKEERKET